MTTTATTTYTARCTREGKWWVIHVPEIDHSTQARRLDQVPETVADLVSLFTDLDPADVTVQVTVAWPEALAARVAEVEAARADAEARAAAAADLRLALAADLTREGLSVRDVARVLGVSHQRVAQLLQPDSAEPAPGGTAQPDREMTSAQPKTTRLTQEDRRTNTTSRAGGRPARGPG